MNLEPKICCPGCLNMPLLGINFNQEVENLNNYIDLYSLCIFNHNKNKESKLHKDNLNDIFSNNIKIDKSKNKELHCENCNKKPIEYHCFNCKRNICKNCFEHHKNHKYYYNYDYISEDELKKINEELNKSKTNLDSNYSLIEKIISKYETQLTQLKNLYTEYKKLNDNLSSIASFILKKYTDLKNLQKPIYYPIYFNLKNILSFDSIQLKFNEEEEELSIEDFINTLSEKIFSGLYFTITDSNLSINLSDYDKIDKFENKCDITNIDNFKKVNIEYDAVIPLSDDKFFGVYYQSSSFFNLKNKKKEIKELEIYNMNSQTTETKIKSNPKNIFINEKYNLIIFLCNDSIDIYNYTNFTLKQQIKIIDERKKRKRENSSLWKKSDSDEDSYYILTHVEFISKNTIGIIFEGDLNYLGEKVDELFEITDDTKIINIDEENDIEKDSYNYSYIIIYQRENDDSNYIPKKASLLAKMNIEIKDVPFFASGDLENEYEDDYCTFTFENMTQISNNEFIFAFKSEIKEDREQEYIYITDKFYKNEMIYYYLNWEKDSSIKKILGSTKENSYLFKIENDEQFYFIYNSSNDFASSLKKFFKENELKVTTINVKKKLNIRNLYIEKNNIIGWDEYSIYVGKIISGELEIISNIEYPKYEYIKYISFKNKYIYSKNLNDNNLKD